MVIFDGQSTSSNELCVYGLCMQAFTLHRADQSRVKLTSMFARNETFSEECQSVHCQTSAFIIRFF